tara:strand:- start:1085 stop:1558 length:474 start_codon:yes stop_codon:yes gene_type:complete
MAEQQNNQPSVELNTTYNYTIENYGFGNLPLEICEEILKDGRPFSYFIEQWLPHYHALIYVPGCKSYDFKDRRHPEILYDEKTFTRNGCKFCPSNMLGQGRTFDQERFVEHSKKLIFCIVSNVDFPNIKIKFVRGEDLMRDYPRGEIPLKDHVKFFN